MYNQSEPSCIEKTKNWKIAIVLQDVDVLKYLTETAKKHLEEKMIVKSVWIDEILSDNSFNFNPIKLISIYKKLFTNVYEYAGNIRSYNFSKNKWILNNDIVIYASYETIMSALKYDFEQEKSFLIKIYRLKKQ